MASFTWLVQPIVWLPDALRPGVAIALVVLLVWFVFVRRGVLDLWRAACRGFAYFLALSLDTVMRLECAITTKRRSRGQAPPKWAFAYAGLTDVVEDGAAWLYGRHQPRGAGPVEHDDAHKESGPSPRPKSAVPWRLCTVIVVGCTAAWITMDQLPATSIPKYRLAQVFDPWREAEEWAGIDSGRGTPPTLVRARLRHELMGVRIACTGLAQCRGWVLLKGRSGAIVATQYVELAAGSTPLVQLRLTPDQVRTAHGGQVVVVRV